VTHTKVISKGEAPSYQFKDKAMMGQLMSGAQH